MPVSTEITGYFASAMAWLFQSTRDEEYLDRARWTARFLVECAWNPTLGTFPFEHPSPSAESGHYAYFFDCGIIIKGLIAVWRVTQEDRLIEVAAAAGRGMLNDFHSGCDFHPVLALPGKHPSTRTPKWSRSPGCYQLKAALAWWRLGEILYDDEFRDGYFEMAEAALRSHAEFPTEASDRHEVMDRLHAYSYFLEGLLPLLERADCRRAYCEGVRRISQLSEEISPSFARSDVYAQLLRARLVGGCADTPDTAREACELQRFQATSGDQRIDGGFYFGRRHGQISPHVNPVSTVFALQALELWRQMQSGETEDSSLCLDALI